MKYLEIAKWFGIVFALAACDERIKRRVEKNPDMKENGREKKILGGAIRLRKHHNRGVALNIMQNKQPVVAAVSAGLSVLVGILLFLAGKNEKPVPYKLGLSLLLGGAISNTMDRLRHHYVVDYFSLGFGPVWLKNIIFNISDYFILLGAILAGSWYDK